MRTACPWPTLHSLSPSPVCTHPLAHAACAHASTRTESGGAARSAPGETCAHTHHLSCCISLRPAPVRRAHAFCRPPLLAGGRPLAGAPSKQGLAAQGRRRRACAVPVPVANRLISSFWITPAAVPSRRATPSPRTRAATAAKTPSSRARDPETTVAIAARPKTSAEPYYVVI